MDAAIVRYLYFKIPWGKRKFIADMYGVDCTAVKRIAAGKTYIHALDLSEIYSKALESYSEGET